MDRMDVKNLITRIRNGDQKALEKIYWMYCDELHHLAFKFLRDKQLAEDAVQDVFFKLWSNRDSLDNEKSIEGLLFISLKNHVLNMLKINKRRILRQFEYSTINTVTCEKTDDALIRSEYQILIKKSLMRLPEVKRQVYELKRVGDYSNDEIAIKLGLSVNTVKSHYYLAKRSIRDYIISYQKSP